MERTVENEKETGVRVLVALTLEGPRVTTGSENLLVVVNSRVTMVLLKAAMYYLFAGPNELCIVPLK